MHPATDTVPMPCDNDVASKAPTGPISIVASVFVYRRRQGQASRGALRAALTPPLRSLRFLLRIVLPEPHISGIPTHEPTTKKQFGTHFFRQPSPPISTRHHTLHTGANKRTPNPSHRGLENARKADRHHRCVMRSIGIKSAGWRRRLLVRTRRINQPATLHPCPLRRPHR